MFSLDSNITYSNSLFNHNCRGLAGLNLFREYCRVMEVTFENEIFEARTRGPSLACLGVTHHMIHSVQNRLTSSPT